MRPDQVAGIREDPLGNKEVLIKWCQQECENSWESAATIQDSFPDFHLEDKVALLGGSTDSSLVDLQ